MWRRGKSEVLGDPMYMDPSLSTPGGRGQVFVFNQFGSQWYLEADRTNRVNGTTETQSVHPFVLPLPKRGSVDTPFDEKATCTVLNEKDPAM